MSKKNKSDKNGFVYSTDPNFRFEEEEESIPDTLTPKQQKLKVKLETKHRGGKTVTLVTGFIGNDDDLQALGKNLKNYCEKSGNCTSNQMHRSTTCWSLKVEKSSSAIHSLSN